MLRHAAFSQEEMGKNGDEDGDGDGDGNGNGDHVCMYCTAGVNTKNLKTKLCI